MRGDSSEVLFDGEEGLAALVHGVLRAAPIDARAALSKRVLVVGGGSLIPGLETRLLDELRARGVKGRRRTDSAVRVLQTRPGSGLLSWPRRRRDRRRSWG